MPVSLSKISTLAALYASKQLGSPTASAIAFVEQARLRLQSNASSSGPEHADLSPFQPVAALNDRLSLVQGDITKLRLDAIVNAANKRMLGGGGVDGSIHRAAGPGLMDECEEVPEVQPGTRCPAGDAKITGGHNLPASHVIHTVGPIGEKPALLASAYRRSLEVAIENGVRTPAFPCISTGVYGYPQDNAAAIALITVRQVLESSSSSLDRIVFCTFLDSDLDIYAELMPAVFPPVPASGVLNDSSTAASVAGAGSSAAGAGGEL